MKFGVASDHAGFDYKTKISALLKKKGYEVVDYGTFSSDRCDYPDFGHALGNAIDNGEVDLGVAFCGTGNGISMTLNKHQHVRAALCWETEIARLAKAHNNANVLVMPARFISYQMVTSILNKWLDTEFEGGRHQGRIDKMPISK
jgi:ribose 5-phosphate isomerase B